MTNTLPSLQFRCALLAIVIYVSISTAFATQVCSKSIHLEIENYVSVQTQRNSTATSSQTVINTWEGYGKASNGAFADFKDSESEVYLPFTLSAAPAATCSFKVVYANTNNACVNVWKQSTADDYDIIYAGKYYLKYAYESLPTNYSQSWLTHTFERSLTADDYMISFYAQKGWSAFDYLTITTDANDAFCEETDKPIHSIIVNIDAADLAKGTANGAGDYPEGTHAQVEVTAASGYAFACWDAIGITLTEAERTSPTLNFVMPTTDVTLTPLFADVYQAWPWKEGLTEWAVSDTPGQWSNQIALGPEHFTTAVVGGKLRVKVKDLQWTATSPQGAIQAAPNYAAVDVNGLAYDAQTGEQLTQGWQNNNGVMWCFNLKNGDYYHVFTAASLAEAKENGLIIKGQNHTITSVDIIGSCEQPTMRTTPTITIADIVYDYSDMTTTNKYVWTPQPPDDVFDFGVWEHKLKFENTAFKNVVEGDIIRIYMEPKEGADRTRISYRCDTTRIDADDQQGVGGMVHTTGDISFNRTVTNLGGDAPDGDGFVDLYVTADMLERLNATGLIIFGEGALLHSVALHHGPFVIKAGETRLVPKCGVDSLIIYQGGQAANVDDVKVYQGIQYIRHAVGGAHGNMFSHWYTFTVPFDVKSVQVYDEVDKQDFAINSVYYQTSDVRDNPTGEGYFYLQYLVSENVSDYDEIFRARWDYISNNGLPKRGDAYIILFKDLWGDQYFANNPIVKFCGGEQTISGINHAAPVLPDEGVEQFFYYANNTMHNITISGSAYVLNESSNLFVLTDNPTIAPFECYVQATNGYKVQHHTISFAQRYSQGNNDGEDPSRDDNQDETNTTNIENNGNAKAPIEVYSSLGVLLQILPAESDFYQGDLPHGCYILRQGEKQTKVIK